MISLAFAFQLAGAVPAIPLEDIGFDLTKMKAAHHKPTDIVVTARRNRDIVVMGIAEGQPLLPPAEIGFIGKSRIGVTAEQKGLGGGAISNRAMVTVKVPF